MLVLKCLVVVWVRGELLRTELWVLHEPHRAGVWVRHLHFLLFLKVEAQHVEHVDPELHVQPGVHGDLGDHGEVVELYQFLAEVLDQGPVVWVVACL